MDVGAKGEAEASVERVVENIGGLNVAGKTFCVGLEGLDVRDTSKKNTLRVLCGLRSVDDSPDL